MYTAGLLYKRYTECYDKLENALIYSVPFKIIEFAGISGYTASHRNTIIH